MAHDETVAEGISSVFSAGSKTWKKKKAEEVDMANQKTIEKSDE